MMQIANGLFHYDKGSPMSSTLSNIGNIIVYAATLVGVAAADFVENNWYVLVMIVFGGIHAYGAIRKNKREEREAEYKIKDRELSIAREDKRLELEEELQKKALIQKEIDRQIEIKQEITNRDHKNKREALYCEPPKPARLKNVSNTK